MIGFAGSAGVVSWDSFSIRAAGKRTEAIFFHPPEMARAGKGLPPPTKTESIQLPDGEIDTETLSPVSL